MSKEKLSADALNDLEKIIEWINGLGPGWNLFGDVDRAKTRLQNVKKKLEQLQREKEELLKFAQSVAMFESWAIHSDERGPINFRANMIVKKYESDLTPKPEKL